MKLLRDLNFFCNRSVRKCQIILTFSYFLMILCLAVAAQEANFNKTGRGTKKINLYADFRESLLDLQSLVQLFKNYDIYGDRYVKSFHIDDAQSCSPTSPKQQFRPVVASASRSPYANQVINEAVWKDFEEAKAAGLTGVHLERFQRGFDLEFTDQRIS